MQKSVQLPNTSFVMTKGFPSFSNLRDALFCLQWWLEQVFLSDIWQAALAQTFLVFSHPLPFRIEVIGRAWGLLCVLGISDLLNCCFIGLRWESVAFESRKVKWNRLGHTSRCLVLQGEHLRLSNSPTWEFRIWSAFLVLSEALWNAASGKQAKTTTNTP